MLEKEIKSKIVIIENDIKLLQTMKFSLTREGLNVVTLSNIEKSHNMTVQQLTNECDIDLIITDIRMPALSDIKLIKMIRNAGISTPILALSGYGNMKMVVELMRSGCNDYLDKPFSLKEFICKITNLLKTNFYVIRKGELK